MRRVVSTLFVATVLFATQAALAATPLVRLHMKDHSNTENPTEMDLRLPLSMLAAMAPTLEQGFGEINLEEQNIDLRAIWMSLRDAGPSQLVSITNPEGSVSVSTTETHLEIHVDQAEKIDVSIPLELVNAFLEQETLDIAAITAALENMTGKDLINVTGSKMELRAWVE